MATWEELSQGERMLVVVYLRDYQIKALRDGLGGEEVIAGLLVGMEAAVDYLEAAPGADGEKGTR